VAGSAIQSRCAVVAARIQLERYGFRARSVTQDYCVRIRLTGWTINRNIDALSGGLRCRRWLRRGRTPWHERGHHVQAALDGVLPHQTRRTPTRTMWTIGRPAARNMAASPAMVSMSSAVPVTGAAPSTKPLCTSMSTNAERSSSGAVQSFSLHGARCSEVAGPGAEFGRRRRARCRQARVWRWRSV
jgi:hypothetical protein